MADIAFQKPDGTKKIGEVIELPCKCMIATFEMNGENVMLYEPCKPDCEFLLFAIEESERQGKRVERRTMEELAAALEDDK